MAITYEWSFPNFETDADNKVKVIHYRLTAVDGDYSASSYGTVGFTPDASAEGFVAYADLTESTVLGWVQAEVDKDATEASLTANIAEQKAPVTSTGTPW